MPPDGLRLAVLVRSLYRRIRLKVGSWARSRSSLCLGFCWARRVAGSLLAARRQQTPMPKTQYRQVASVPNLLMQPTGRRGASLRSAGARCGTTACVWAGCRARR
jgi:hypothetical protein